MLRRVKDLEKCAVGATDGAIGSVHDFYFDDERWVIRYLVVNTGAWLSHRLVLISPHSIRDWGWEGNTVPVSITREQVKHSPPIDTDKPVSRQYERSYYDYYTYPPYWGGVGLWGGYGYPGMLAPGSGVDDAESELEQIKRAHEDPHLRSCNEVHGYHLHASDGEIGHVHGYLIDEKSWAIRFLIVNTSNWWLGHQVLIASEWLESVNWSLRKVSTDLTRHAVKHSPAYDPELLLDFAGEQSVYKHYGRAAYREDEAKARNEHPDSAHEMDHGHSHRPGATT